MSAQVQKSNTAKYYLMDDIMDTETTTKTPLLVAIVIASIAGYTVGTISANKQLKTKYAQEQLCPQNKP